VNGLRGEKAKSQGPRPKEYSNPNIQILSDALGACDWSFFWSLEIGFWVFRGRGLFPGIWELEFGISPYRALPLQHVSPGE
jgi:hypothetical protein